VALIAEQKMNFDLSLYRLTGKTKRLRFTKLALLSTALVAASAIPALADIDNSAEAEGTYGASTITSPPDTANVPVAPAAPSLTVAKSAGVPVDTTGDGVIGPGDTITYSYTVTNTGNVTINNVVPVDTGPTFNNIAGTNALGAFSPASANLAPTGPSSTQVFTADYILSASDAYNAAGISAATGDAVENTATATGTPATGVLAPVAPSSAETEIPANPLLQITKTWAFRVAPAGDVDGDGFADLNDVIVYTYEIANTGNVAISNVQVNDTHEGSPVAIGGAGIANEVQVSAGPVGSNSGGIGTDGIWDNLTAGSVIRFTYTHTVTQAEVDGG
jgi:uncharacterized repeat protein (TIGR01451 family)